MLEDPRPLTETAAASATAGLSVICSPDGDRLVVRSAAAGEGWGLPVPDEASDFFDYVEAIAADAEPSKALRRGLDPLIPGATTVWTGRHPAWLRLRWLPLPDGGLVCHLARSASGFTLPRAVAPTGVPAGEDAADGHDQLVWTGRIVDGRVVPDFAAGGFRAILTDGHPARQLEGWIRAVHPDDRPRMLARLTGIRPDSPPSTAEYRVVRPDGTIRWVRSTLAPFEGAFPEVGVWALVTDITAERAARQELESILGVLQELVLEFAWDASGEWFVRSMSPSAAPLMGVERSGAPELAAEFERRVHQHDMPLIEGALRRLRAGASSERVTVRLMGDRGPVRLEGTLVSTRDPSGAPRVLGVMSDVTGRHAVEARLRRIADAIQNVVFEADRLPDGAFVLSYVSPSAASFIGAPVPADPAGAAAALMGAIHVDDVGEVVATAERVLAEGGTAAVEYRLIRADGDVRRVRTTLARFEGDDGRPRLAGVKTDITDLWDARALERRVVEAVNAVVMESRMLPDGRWAIAWTPELEELLARPVPRDPVQCGGTWFRAIHPADRDEVVAIARRMSIEGTSLPLQHRIVRADGEVRWVRSVVEPDADDPTRALAVVLDVTDERSAGERLQRVLDGLDDVVVEGEVGADEQWHATYASASLARLLGRALPDHPAARARALEEAVHPADRLVLLRELRTVARRGGGGAVTVRVIRADGEIRWLRATVARRDAPPARAAVTGVVSDVTELLQTGQALQRAEQGLNRLVTGTTAIAYEIEALPGDGLAVRYVGPAAAPLLGVEVPTDPVERMAVLGDLVHPDDRAALLTAFRRVLAGAPPRSVLFRVRTPNGELRMQAAVTRLGPGLIGGVASDAAEVLEADDALRAAQGRLSRVIAAIGEAVYEMRVTKDGVDRVTYASPQLWRILGLDGAPAAWESLGKVIHPDDRDALRARVMRTLEGVPLNVDARAVWPDGQIRWLRVTGRPRLQPDGAVLVAGTVGDVTEERAAAADDRRPVEAGPGAPGARLTERQMAVLRLLAEGAGTDDISTRLQITRTTVANHVAAILRRLGARSRLEAVHVARRQGLLGDD